MDLSLTKALIREEVCATCFRCPPEFQQVPLDFARECEANCELFLNLPRLIEVVHRFGGEPPCGYGTVVENLPCGTCAAPARCSTEACSTPRPLDRYAGQVMAVIESSEHKTRQD